MLKQWSTNDLQKKLLPLSLFNLNALIASSIQLIGTVSEQEADAVLS
jgi:hypothetical protein